MSMLDAAPEPGPAPPPAPSSATTATYSRAVRLELHKRMQNLENISGSGLNSQVLQTFADSDSDSEEEEAGARGAGAEIAPPCDMNYFSSASANNPRGFRSHHDMADAFSAGLEANKK